jgi:hypothetical protein
MFGKKKYTKQEHIDGLIEIYEGVLFDYKQDELIEGTRPFSTAVLEKAVRVLKNNTQVNPKKVENWVTRMEKLYFYPKFN